MVGGNKISGPSHVPKRMEGSCFRTSSGDPHFSRNTNINHDHQTLAGEDKATISGYDTEKLFSYIDFPTQDKHKAPGWKHGRPMKGYWQRRWRKYICLLNPHHPSSAFECINHTKACEKDFFILRYLNYISENWNIIFFKCSAHHERPKVEIFTTVYATVATVPQTISPKLQWRDLITTNRDQNFFLSMLVNFFLPSQFLSFG